MILENKVIYQDGAIREFEKPEVCEAIKVANANKWVVGLSPTEWDERKARLKKEHEENTKSPCPVGEQPNEGNPALAESASQFNDALLDEQAKEIESLRDKCKKYADILDSVGDKLRELKAENRRIKNSDLNLEGLANATRELKEKDKKIVELTDKNERLKDQVAVLYECKENNEKYNLKQIKRLGNEITRLNKAIHKKNMKIEELRKESSRHLRGKIKMFYENEDLEQMLKDKNAVLSDVAEELRLSKIREKNLTEVGQKYMKENEELKEKLDKKIVDKIDAQALKSAESALAYKEKVIEKLQKQLKYKSPLPSGSVEAINIYVNNISRARRVGFNKSVDSTMGETELSETYEYGDKKLKYALHFNEDGSITYECSDPEKKNRHNGDGLPTPEEPKHDNSFKGFISKTIDNFNRRAAELGLVGSKDGNGIIDQMVGVDIAEEGADLTGVIIIKSEK